MVDDDRTTALGLARYAYEYYEAALGADDRIGMQPGYEISAPSPVMFLVAHSMELALKAYMRNAGLTVADIRKLGHDLDACFRIAVAMGFGRQVTLTREEEALLKLISDLHASTEFRYIQTGSKKLPVFGPMAELAKKILRPVCNLVGYTRPNTGGEGV